MDKKIFIFGNQDVPFDSTPINILPQLKEKFPGISFIIIDPNEEINPSDLEEDIVIIDITFGINKITIFNSLENFIAPPNISMHDFDAFSNLRLLQKLGKIKKIKIIAIPPQTDKEKIIDEISKFLN